MNHRISNFNLVERSLEACALLRLVGLWLLLISELSFSLAATTSYISMTLVVSEMLLKSATSFLLSFNSKKEIYLKTDLRVFSGETSWKRGHLRSKSSPSLISPQVSSPFGRIARSHARAALERRRECEGRAKSLSLLASLAMIGGLACRLLIHYFVVIDSFKVKNNSPCARALKIHFILNFCLQMKC